MVKKVFFSVSFLFICIMGITQKNAELEQRLAEYMTLSKKMDVDGVINYTYPRLFELFPRDQVKAAMKNAFENADMSMQFDSLKIDTVYPVFKFREGSYAKVVYSMSMTMRIRNADGDSTAKQAPINEKILADMRTEYGADNVRVESDGQTLRVRMTAPMIAAKDSYAKKWCFINFSEDDEQLKQLFSKEVLTKITSHK